MSTEETSYDAMMDNIADKSTGSAGKSNSCSLSIEELLKPRYKVIADWPMNHFFDVGDIIEMKMMPNGKYWNGEDSYYLTEEQMRTFPHLFKKLEWWEERKESEMPEYVKRISKNGFVSWHNIKINEIVKPTRWFKEKDAMYFFSRDSEGSQLNFDTGCFQPSTEEEYIQYQQNKNVCQ